MSFMALNLLGHNNYCSVGVMELCLLNLLIMTDWFLCNSNYFVLFESLSHVINQESHVYSWNLGKIYLVHSLKFSNLPCFIHSGDFTILKSQLGKFIPNFPLQHVITSTNSYFCVLFEGLPHVINQESHVYSWNLGKIYLRFQNFKKVNSVNSSQISLLNMWLLAQGCF